MRVFIKTDDKNRVTAISSEIFIPDTTGWTEIDRGDGDRYVHAQGNYFPKPLTDENGVYRYKYTDGIVSERTAEEMAADMFPSPDDIVNLKTKRIQESKMMLVKWLNDNPILYTDGKYYSVTEEKQALLNGNLASYERATQAGIEYPLKWNSTGEECTDWSYNDLLTLSLNIAAYVAPKVAIQQNIELDIKACETMDEINAVVIDYDRNGDNSETNS